MFCEGSQPAGLDQTSERALNFRRNIRLNSPDASTPLNTSTGPSHRRRRTADPDAIPGGRSRSPSPSLSPFARIRSAAAAGDETEHVFRKLDANGDGHISRSKLAAHFKSLCHVATDDEVSRMMP